VSEQTSRASKSSWLRSLPSAQAKALRAASRVRRYQAGDSVFGPSRDPNEIYVLEDGLVRVLRVTPTGAEFTLRYVQPGDVFGAASVMSGMPRAAFAQAKAASRILQVPRGAFLAMLQAHNGVLYSLAKKLAGMVIEVESRAEDLGLLDARPRLARLLLRLAKEHGHHDAQGLTIGLPLTHEEIATLIATSRQTVSLHLREFADAGLVARRGRRLVLRNPRGLEAIA